MNTIVKMIRFVHHEMYRRPGHLLLSSFKQNILHRNFNLNNQRLGVKMFIEHENKYAYDIMVRKGYALCIGSFNKLNNENIITKEEFEENLSAAESNKSSPQFLFETFSKFGPYAKKNGLCISNTMFDKFIDNFTDNIKHASDSELKNIFYALNEWPEAESVRSRNYIEVWAALDDECHKRIINWNFKEMLSYVSLFYMLNVTRVSDYSQKCLQKLATRAKQLTPEHLVQTLFFVGVMRRSPFDMNNFEVHLQNNFTKFSIDDLAIMSMGFFKSKTPLRSTELINMIMEQIILHKSTINEVSLAALLKVLRYSIKTNVEITVNNLLEELQHEVPRLSIMCNVHIALLGMATLSFNQGCLDAIANNVIEKIAETRMKDLERLVLTFGTFNYIPRCKENFIDKVLEELRNPDRSEEIEKHGRSFACCVAFLSLLQVYPVDLINKVLNPECLDRVYNKNFYFYGKEVLIIHNVAQIFCKDADIYFLPKNKSVPLAKRFTDYVPTAEYEKQYNASERMVLDVVRVLEDNRGGKEYVIGDHILPHYQRGDIILGNSPDGSPLPVTNQFSIQNFGLIKHPPDKKNLWIVLVIVGRNGLIKSTNKPIGAFIAKSKELKALGFYPALVSFKEYMGLKTDQEKHNYLSQLIRNAIESRNF